MRFVFGTIIKRKKNIAVPLEDEGFAFLFGPQEQHMQSISKPAQLQNPLTTPILSARYPF